MSTLISMVGQQPAAVATTTKTLKEQADLKQIFLLPTEKTTSEYSRLELYLRNDLGFPAEMIKKRVIAEDVSRPDGNDLVWNVIKNILDKPDLSQPVYFDISPGLNYQVALISYHLKNDHRFQAIYADNRKLHNLTNPGGWELSHIGFKQLLELYGLKENNGKEPAGPGEIAEDVTITGGKQTLYLEYACERHGRFFGLYRIWKDNRTQGLEQKKESHRVKQQARLIECIEETPGWLNSLNPDLIIWTNDGQTLHRLSASSVRFIEKTENQLEAQKRFSQKTEENLGDGIPGHNEKPMNFSTGPIIETKNSQWNGANLILALGSDPSPTLKALYTHKPREVIFLIDAENPTICSYASRLRRKFADMPMHKATFWSMDMRGNLRQEDDFIAYIRDNVWFMNATPGTKAQTWQLARLPVATVWTLVDQKQKAMPIAGDMAQSGLSFDYPPIALHSCIVGGQLAEVGVDMAELKGKINLLTNMRKVIVKIVAAKRGGWLPKKIEWKPGEKGLLHDESNYIKCLKINAAGESLEFEACYNGRVETGWIKSPPNMGHWFEEVVAGAFLSAGARDIQDIVVGLKWDWLHKKPDGVHFRNDLDVAVLWMGHYIGISCKIGLNENDLEQISAEVIAVTRTGMGRFALPVLVRGGIDSKKAVNKAEDTAREDPMEIGMSLLDDKSQLNKLMVQYLLTRRTVRS